MCQALNSLIALSAPICAGGDPASAPTELRSSLVSAFDDEQVGYDDGFFLRTRDRRFELVINGRAQVDAASYDADREPSSDFIVRRMRLEFTARIEDRLLMHLEPNFLPEGTEMEEAWLGFDVASDDARLMLGRMKAPFTLEERNPQANIDFARFSIIHQFAPQEDHGLFFYGHTPSQEWQYDFAVFNGTGGADTNSGKDVAARCVWHPFAGDASSDFQHFQFGAAATYGVQDQDVSGGGIENEVKLPVIEFANGVQLDGARARVGIETAWFRGPWFAQAELVHIEQDMSLGASDRTIDFNGGYLTLSRVLTGEDKSFGATQPSSPFDFGSMQGRGAWSLAARYSELSCDSDLENAGFAVPGTFTHQVRTASLGFNWIPNTFTILRNAWMHTWYSDDVQVDHGAIDHEDAFIVELQLNF